MENDSLAKQIILGIDPGSRCTGFGLIQQQGQKIIHLAHGHIRCSQQTQSQRLAHIFTELQKIINQYRPTSAAIEQIFTCRNPQSALKLGQARGAAMAVTALAQLAISEYSAREIKQAVVGYGAAGKGQVQHMVMTLLGLTHLPQSDAADALAIAICHAHQHHYQQKIAKGKICAGAK